MPDQNAALLRDVLTYLDQPYVFWPHHENCSVKRRDLIDRLLIALDEEAAS